MRMSVHGQRRIMNRLHLTVSHAATTCCLLRTIVRLVHCLAVAHSDHVLGRADAVASMRTAWIFE